MENTIGSRFSLKGRTALITGASRGIGAAIARTYAEAGARLVICSRNSEDIEAAAAALRGEGAEVLAVAASVSDRTGRERLVDRAMDWAGRIDILVNNAGANPRYCGLEDLEEKALDVVLNVNFKGVLFLSQLVFKAWMRENGGTIINVSSVGGYRCMPGISGYCAVKAGLNHLGRCMAVEWGKYGIRVNTLAPGIVKTDFSQALWQNPEIRARMAANPVPRFGTIEDVAGVALLMASDASAYITGGDMIVDGGSLVSGAVS